MKKELRLGRMFYLYFRLMNQNLKSLLEYQADFVIMLISSVFTQILGLIFIRVIYMRIPNINGWNFWEVAFIYAMIFFTEGTASLFFEGTWGISRLVNRGELDIILLRPISPVLQILASNIGINGLGNMVVGSVIIIQAFIHVNMNWSITKALIAVILLLSAIVIRVSINFMSNSVVFWTNAPSNSVPFMVHSISDFAKYPITIYSVAIQAAITIIIPYAFIGFFPASYIFGKGNLGNLGLLTPLVAIYCVVVSLFIFYSGLKKYESAGN